MVVGPYRSYPFAGGKAALYLLRFDKSGTLQSPQTFELLKAEIAAGATDVFLFSHGWNNTFDEAFARYDSFINGFIAQQQQFSLPTPQPYRPVLIGVIWPSTSFVMPWENGPVIAAVPADQARTAEEMTRLITAQMSPADAARFAELVDGGAPLGPDDAREAATLLCTTLPEDGDPDGQVGKPKPEDVLASWQRIGAKAQPVADATDYGTAAPAQPGAGPAAAGLSFDPRDLLRMGTVWTMHTRAGTVGANGVSRLVQWVLDRPNAPRLHLIGHSFGAKVVLSALSVGDAPAHKARSMLLLEPAINRWCFAPLVTGSGAPGGYHVALERLESPIFTTFSSHDQPLHEVFQLVIRDVGELQIAAIGDTDRYGALGGYGPNGLDALGHTLPALDAGSGHYDVPAGVRVVGVDGGVELSGGTAIKGHGDVSTPVTWWALHELTRLE
jgi:hypothetical protein